MSDEDKDELLDLLGGGKLPDSDQFRRLVTSVDSHRVLAKVFLLDGTPFVFEKNPMKYIIFKEQVADRFEVGSQDVCIVGSARLGFSPSPSSRKYGVAFSETSDVDVVVISEEWFDKGSQHLFRILNDLEPRNYEIQPFIFGDKAATKGSAPPVVPLENWRDVKEAVRNFVYQNFNPGRLPYGDPLRDEIFDKITSTAGLFLALEPKVFVSKIRCRFFRNWKAAEDYYSNSLRVLADALENSGGVETEIEDDDDRVEVKAPTGEAVVQSEIEVTA